MDGPLQCVDCLSRFTSCCFRVRHVAQQEPRRSSITSQKTLDFMAPSATKVSNPTGSVRRSVSFLCVCFSTFIVYRMYSSAIPRHRQAPSGHLQSLTLKTFDCQQTPSAEIRNETIIQEDVQSWTRLAQKNARQVAS